MKKFVVAAAFFAGITAYYAQDSAENAKKTWYHNDYATSKVYGVNTENAYKFLESKGLKPKTVVVGILDSGVQVNHPGLAKNMWTNPNEIPGNGKDDDGNGYIDDVHGWNFMGNKTTDLGVDNLEVTRVVAKYAPIFEGADSAQNKANQAKMPEEFEMYMTSKEMFNSKSIKAKQNYQRFTKMKALVPTMVTLMNGKSLSEINFSTLKGNTQDESMALEVLSNLAKDPDMATKSPKEVGEFMDAQMKEALDYYGPQATQQYNLEFDPRKETVGDNYDDYSERFYGNNHYEGPDALHGTHVAGIVAGLPHGTEVQYGVASKVAKIMAVRTVPDGDERDKDVANSIRYAVDNGAKILNMSFGKPVSPGKTHVWDAFKYAESKGVLLVKAAGNENQDIEKNVAYPTNYYKAADEAPFVSNMIVVGASTNDNAHLRAGFSNYNSKAVDVFAPGQEIYATVTDSKYQYLQGTSMASPVVAGAAAVLKAYMPNLTPAQIIESLKNTVNKADATFAGYSSAGGVIDLAKAAEYAYTKFYKAEPAKDAVKKATNKKKVVTKKTVKKK